MPCTCTIMSSVARPTLQYFSNLSLEGSFYEKFAEHKLCVLIFSTIFIRKISHSKKNGARYDKKCILVFI
jgi:hypothetical protein